MNIDEVLDQEEPFDFEKFDPATATDAEILAYGRAGGSLAPLIEAGRGRGGLNSEFPPFKDPGPVEDMPMILKSVRVTVGLFEAVDNVGHPEGFSGVVREALTEWLATHTGREAEVKEIKRAIEVLQRHAARLEAA